MKLKAWKLKGGASVIIQKIPIATSDICHAFLLKCNFRVTTCKQTKNIHSLNFVLYLEEEEEIGVFKLSPILSFNDDGPIRNPSWEQKRTVGYVIVSRFFGVRTVTIPCTLNLSNSFGKGNFRIEQGSKLFIKRWTTPRSPPTSPSIMN
jgi:hypothetical protein